MRGSSEQISSWKDYDYRELSAVEWSDYVYNNIHILPLKP